MNNTPNAALAEPWKELWNGDLTLTDKIIYRQDHRGGASQPTRRR